MLKMKNVQGTYAMKVYTDKGDYFGDIEDAIITSNKIYGWKISASKSSLLTKIIGSAKGVIVPQQLVKAMGDIAIISQSAVPNFSEDKE